MKKQVTTAAAFTVIALFGSSFALAGPLDFDALADADILTGGSEFVSSTPTEVIAFHDIADADLLAGDDSWIADSARSIAAVEFDSIADADHLTTLVAGNYGSRAE